MISSEQTPESLVQRIRALADKRQKEAAKERKLSRRDLLGAASGYRALADALERQPTLPWLRPSGLAAKMGAAAGTMHRGNGTTADTCLPPTQRNPPMSRSRQSLGRSL